MGKKNFSYDKVLCKHFGRKIVLLRKEKNISQAELAFKIGVQLKEKLPIPQSQPQKELQKVSR